MNLSFSGCKNFVFFDFLQMLLIILNLNIIESKNKMIVMKLFFHLMFGCFEMFDKLLKEPYREERRIRLGRSKFIDIFFYSGVYDYRSLRILINFPIGFLIAFLLYKFG